MGNCPRHQQGYDHQRLSRQDDQTVDPRREMHEYPRRAYWRGKSPRRPQGYDHQRLSRRDDQTMDPRGEMHEDSQGHSKSEYGIASPSTRIPSSAALATENQIVVEGRVPSNCALAPPSVAHGQDHELSHIEGHSEPVNALAVHKDTSWKTPSNMDPRLDNCSGVYALAVHKEPLSPSWDGEIKWWTLEGMLHKTCHDNGGSFDGRSNYGPLKVIH